MTFDATGTLFHCPNLVEIYCRVLRRHGLEVSEDGIRHFFPLVWQEFECLTELGRDRFASHPQGARGWWQRFVERMCALLDAGRPSPFAVSELYDCFARSSTWEVFPEVPATLETLRNRGLALAVVSNWDERLPRLLDRLGLAPYFDAVVVSASLGIAKPHPEIFRYALRRLQVEPQRALHVGDSQRDDVEGALGAGLETLRVDRGRRRQGSGRRRGDAPSLGDLSSLVEAIS